MPMLLGSLPGGDNGGTSVIIGNNEVYPAPLIFTQQSPIARGIDHVLEHQESPHAVIWPLPTQIHDCFDHPWGPSPMTRGNMGRFYLTFLKIQGPATRPPVGMMTIRTPGIWRDIEISPEREGDFVTVAEVQDEVVKWMKEIAALSLSQGQKMTLSENTIIPMPDGNEVEVELWQWKGLKRHGLESDVWELCL